MIRTDLIELDHDDTYEVTACPAADELDIGEVGPVGGQFLRAVTYPEGVEVTDEAILEQLAAVVADWRFTPDSADDYR